MKTLVVIVTLLLSLPAYQGRPSKEYDLVKFGPVKNGRIPQFKKCGDYFALTEKSDTLWFKFEVPENKQGLNSGILVGADDGIVTGTSPLDKVKIKLDDSKAIPTVEVPGGIIRISKKDYDAEGCLPKPLK